MKAIRDFSRSSSFSLSVLFTALLSLGILYIGYFIVISEDKILIRESLAAINVDAGGMDTIFQLGGIDAITDVLKQRLEAPENRFIYVLTTTDERIILSNAPQSPSIDSVNSVLSTTLALGADYELFIGRNIDDLKVAQWVSSTFGWLIVFALCLIAGLSLWVSHYVVSRINAISDTADQIMATGDLSARLPIESNWDDLSKLAVSLNSMLDEIEHLVDNIQTVSDNIAHDLRTPLTRLRQHIENQIDDQSAQPLLHEADNLLSMFNGLLRIADIESDKRRSAFQMNNLGAIAHDVVELYQPLAEEKQVVLHLDIQAVEVLCDRDLIFQCIANVLDNAIKFSNNKGRIELGVKDKQSLPCITIDDTGIGISPDKFNDITRRFYRADSSRTTQGNGLGMAMVAAIVALHKGQIIFIDNPLDSNSGLGVQITLPSGQSTRS